MYMSQDAFEARPTEEASNVIPLFQADESDRATSEALAGSDIGRPLVVIDIWDMHERKTKEIVDLRERVYAGDRIALQALRNLHK